jgi:hypothetical protein
VLLIVAVTVARGVVVKPLRPHALVRTGVCREQLFFRAESNPDNLCLEIQLLHPNKELHGKADVLELHRESNLQGPPVQIKA